MAPWSTCPRPLAMGRRRKCVGCALPAHHSIAAAPGRLRSSRLSNAPAAAFLIVWWQGFARRGIRFPADGLVLGALSKINMAGYVSFPSPSRRWNLRREGGERALSAITNEGRAQANAHGLRRARARQADTTAGCGADLAHQLY